MDRRLAPNEKHCCEVGSGECIRDAQFALDNGEGGTFYVCARHAKDMIEFTGICRKLSAHKIEQLEAAVDKQWQAMKASRN